MDRIYRPVDLARSVGVSAQTVRKYETWGFLPPGPRSASSHRQYGERHLQALRVARVLIAGYGWAVARTVLQLVHRGDLAAAYAAVDAAHAAIHAERQDLHAMLTALRAIAGEVPSDGGAPSSEMLVGEAARRVGVRVSTLRFWEQLGLLQPDRDQTNRYRRYDVAQLRQLQLVALLRRSGYDVQAIRPILAELRSGRPDQALHAAEQRLTALTELSRRRCAATASLWRYLDAPAGSPEAP